MRTISVLLLLTAATGCLDDDSGGGGGGGDLVWMPRDAGIPPRPDSGPRSDGGVRECFDFPAVPAALLPRCTAATRDCVEACPADTPGEECRNTCWATDPTPRSGAPDDVGCNDCILRQLISCIDTAGCHGEIQRYFCCIIDNCPTGEDACISAMCASEAEGMFICGYTLEPGCFGLTSGDIGMCYAESDPESDAGAPAPVDAGAGEDAGGAS